MIPLETPPLPIDSATRLGPVVGYQPRGDRYRYLIKTATGARLVDEAELDADERAGQ